MTENSPSNDSGQLDPLIGTYLEERYRIESLLGKGGSAAVYKAFDERVGRMVAVKLPKNSGAFAEESKAGFEKEAKRYIRLQHPNTLRLFDYGQTAHGQTYIVTELLEGETLSERLDRYREQGRKGIGPKQTLSLLKDVASALSEAHAIGLVHRDLKPSNIFLQTLGGQEVVKVIDFGISKDLQEMTMTGSSTLWGTPLYMSPEQAHGGKIDARSDLYTLGVIAFECLTGRPPFSGSTPYAILMQHIDSPPPTLAEAGYSQPLPQGYEAMLNRLLEKTPEQRTLSSDVLIAEIEMVEEIWSSLRLTGTSINANAVQNSNRPILLVTLFFGVLGLFAYFFWEPSERNDSRPDAVALKPPKGSSTSQVSPKLDASIPVRQGIDRGLKIPVTPIETPKKAATAISLTSVPTGALVDLDGNSIGTTPLSTTVDLVSKDRKLSVRLKGYQTQTFIIAADELRFEGSATLERKPKKRQSAKKGRPFKLKQQ